MSLPTTRINTLSLSPPTSRTRSRQHLPMNSSDPTDTLLCLGGGGGSAASSQILLVDFPAPEPQNQLVGSGGDDSYSSSTNSVTGGSMSASQGFPGISNPSSPPLIVPNPIGPASFRTNSNSSSALGPPPPPPLMPMQMPVQIQPQSVSVPPLLFNTTSPPPRNNNFTLVNFSSGQMNQEDEGDEEEEEDNNLNLRQERGEREPMLFPLNNNGNNNNHPTRRQSNSFNNPGDFDLFFPNYQTANPNTRSNGSGGNNDNHFYPIKKPRPSTSSLSSSSEDSDTSFLVPNKSSNNTNGVIKNGGRMMMGNGGKGIQNGNFILSDIQFQHHNGAGNNSGANHKGQVRKKLRKRSSKRKPQHNPHYQHREGGSDAILFPLCCCVGPEEDNHNRNRMRSPSSKARFAYVRFICTIVMIIFITTFVSIMVSLQRKVDSLSLEMNRLNPSSPGYNIPSVSSNNEQSMSNVTNSTTVIQDLLVRQEQLNASISDVNSKLSQISEKLAALEKQPSVDDVRKDLARLGSEMKGSIEEMQKEFNALKQQTNSNNAINSNDVGQQNKNSEDIKPTA